MRPEIGHTIDPVKDVLRVGFPSESNTLSACTHVCAPCTSAPVVPFFTVSLFRHRSRDTIAFFIYDY